MGADMAAEEAAAVFTAAAVAVDSMVVPGAIMEAARRAAVAEVERTAAGLMAAAGRMAADRLARAAHMERTLGEPARPTVAEQVARALARTT
jgi:hypothetical protein